MLSRLTLQGSIVAVAVFLAIQGGFVSWVAASERLPTPPALEQFPSALGGWSKISEDPIDANTIAQLRADRIMSWNYANAQSHISANWFVAWFQTQRNGAQPHSPKVCLPGSGWMPEISDRVVLNSAAGAITANRYVVIQGRQRAVVVYWFETPRRAIANEWAAKFWVVADAVRDHRTDTSLARVVVYENGQGTAAATATAVEFAEQAYSALRKALANPDELASN